MESPKSLRSSKDGVGLDRLSDMPDQVIVHILSFMPTPDAVRTMLLRRFGNLWTLVSALRFDFREHYVEPVFSDDEDDDDDDIYDKEQPFINEAISRFARFVQNVLMLHRRSTIDLFHLDFDQYKGNYDEYESICDDVQVWLRLAVDRQVKKLSFTCDYNDDLAAPRCVFTSQNLFTLQLAGCLLERYKQQPQLHMGSLRKLSLIGVHGSDEAFNQLISACTSLQDLHIYLAEGLQNLYISAPSLTSLNLEILDYHPFTLSCPGVKDLHISVCGFSSESFLLDLVDVSSVQELSVGRLPEGLSRTMTFFKQCQNVEVFTLSSQAFQQLCGLEKIDFPQNRWQHLGLRPEWDHERCLEVIIELVKISVNLEGLLIYDGQSSGDCEVLTSAISTTCEMPKLTEVRISVDEKYREVQLQLVEYILRNAAVLEELVFMSEENQLTRAEKRGFVKQAKKFKKASVNALVCYD